jgi:hypothetical protein
MATYTHTKEEMIEYYRDKWHYDNGTIDYDYFFNMKDEMNSFKNTPSMYWLDEIVCTMDIENLFEMR